MDVSLSTFRDWHKALANVFSSLYTKQFPVALINALETLVNVESVIITLEHTDHAPKLLYDQGIPLDKRNLVINRYFSVGHLLDPFSLALTGGLKQGFCLLSEIAPDHFYNSSYYQSYYLAAGSVEDCYFVIDVDEKNKISICLYHGQVNYRYSLVELEAMRAIEPLVRQLVLSHWGRDMVFSASQELVEPPNKFGQGNPLKTALISLGLAKLTEREVEVVQLILRGHSSKSAAQVLGLSADTVREYRKNLYKKLNINSQLQLFSLFIDYISSRD